MTEKTQAGEPEQARRHVRWALAVATAMAAGVLAGSALSQASYVISQKGQQFQPRQLAIQAGESLVFVNDDGDLLHHAYLVSEKFSFDSDDQKPGSKFTVIFPSIGNFTVLCAIHPKMRLLVHVN